MLLKKLKRIIGDEWLKVEIYSDEIVFSFYEIEIPIVYDIKTEEVLFKPFYMIDLDKNFCMDSEMLGEVSELIDIIESRKGEIRAWIGGKRVT